MAEYFVTYAIKESVEMPENTREIMTQDISSRSFEAGSDEEARRLAEGFASDPNEVYRLGKDPKLVTEIFRSLGKTERDFPRV